MVNIFMSIITVALIGFVISYFSYEFGYGSGIKDAHRKTYGVRYKGRLWVETPEHEFKSGNWTIVAWVDQPGYLPLYAVWYAGKTEKLGEYEGLTDAFEHVWKHSGWRE